MMKNEIKFFLILQSLSWNTINILLKVLFMLSIIIPNILRILAVLQVVVGKVRTKRSDGLLLLAIKS